MTDRHRFHAALQHAPVRLFAQDRDLRYTWIVNPALEDPGAILGKTDAETLSAESAARLTEVKTEALRTGRSVRREVQLEFPTGPRIFDLWIEPTRDADGVVDGVACTALDITERKQAEEALSVRTTQLNFALAATGVGMWLNTLPLGKLDWDRRTRELFFVPEGAQPTVELFFSRLHPDDREPTKLAVGQALRDATVYSMDHRVIDPVSGAIRWIRSAGQATYDDRGEPIRFDGINYDITDQKKTEASLRDLAAQLQEADRSKDRFLATLAHELRNPLAPIGNAVQVIAKRLPQDPDVQWASEVVERQLKMVSRLLDDLLDLSRVVLNKLTLQRHQIDLAVVIAAALETSRPLIDGAGHTVTLDLPKEPVHVVGDSLRLSQVFANLLNNAAKYTGPGGHIGLHAWVDGTQVVVSVSDDGMGIAEEFMPSLFNIFSQAESSVAQSQGGLGIGLSLVRRLVELHGGTIEPRSEGLGHGATFTVRLPLVPAGRVESPGELSNATALVSRGLRVLVADDNRDSADSLAILLQMDGCEVRTVYDGARAIEVAREFKPQVMLLDLGMPGLSGYDVCRSIRQFDWGLNACVVALTGWGQDGDRRKTRIAGFDHHLVKPGAPEEINRILSSLSLGR
jgi:signal transduction histidine kinase